MQASGPAFFRAFALAPGRADPFHPAITRVLAPNPGPMTFTGSLTYLAGTSRPFLIDPGPDEPAHLEALLGHIGSRPLAGILITHSHRDHDGLTEKLSRATHAPVHRFGAGLKDGDVFETPGLSLTAHHMPGHADDHVCFLMQPGDVLFSGDHVMTWNTSIITDMAAYLASMERAIALSPALLCPGHGPEKSQPQLFLRGLVTHRRMREAAVLAAVQAGRQGVPAITEAAYPGLPEGLKAAAQLSVRAHLEHLISQGRIALEGALYLALPIR